MKIEDVSHTYTKPGNEPISVLRDISMSIYEDNVLCIVGKSGCGKTTLLKIIAGITSPTSGRVFMNSRKRDIYRDITEKPANKRDIGFVFQSEKALFPHLNVYENVEFPFRVGGKSVHGEEESSEVNRMIAKMGLEQKRESQIHELSGGMKQRVSIARALVYRPSLLLLDEPLTSLDNERKDSIIEVILDIKDQIGNTIVHVTHDDRDVKEISDRVMVIKDGGVLRHENTQKVLSEENSEEVKSLLRI